MLLAELCHFPVHETPTASTQVLEPMVSTSKWGIYPRALGSDEDLARFYSEHPNAEHILLIGFGLISLDGLLCFQQLRTLSIQGLYHSGSNPELQDTISDFSALPRLESLTQLSIHDCQYFDDRTITAVAQIRHLKTLRISSFMYTITDFTPLTALKELKTLDISGYYKWHSHRSIFRRIFRGYYSELDRQAAIIRDALCDCDVML